MTGECEGRVLRDGGIGCVCDVFEVWEGCEDEMRASEMAKWRES